ncbi:MAG: hypothetical protein ACI9XB_004677 [Gammaproteobacteria bacterium]|jgi:hypothetical protein
MKNIILFLFLVFILSVNSCFKEDDLLSGQENEEWAELCSDFDGGSIDLKINGKDWSSGCVQATYSETISDYDDSELRFLFVYAYNHDITFSDNTDIELVYFIWTESKSAGGETEVTNQAFYYDGFYDYQQAASDPNYELEELNIYFSDEYDTDNNMVNVTQTTDSEVKGNVSFTLLDEESETETLTITGNFTATITE